MKKSIHFTVHKALFSMMSMGIMVVGAPAKAAAIFDYPGVPNHAGHNSWTDGVPHFHQHHFHDKQHQANPPDAKPGHDVAHELSGTRTNEPDYDPYSVWVNETYRVFDGSGGGAAEEFFSHGFIIEDKKNMPEYQFLGDNTTLFDVAGNAFDAKPGVRTAFGTWSGLTEDDPHLNLGLEFREFANDGDAAEIKVSFVDYINGAVAAWNPGALTLQFRRYDDAAKTTKHKWYIGANAAGIANDAAVDDYLTVALHEVGHVVGLDHQNDTDDIMTTLAGRGDKVKAGEVFRKLSGDDILGARDLYSIPAVPEPEIWVMIAAGLGLVSFATRRRKEIC